jgi:hypothetical protein
MKSAAISVKERNLMRKNYLYEDAVGLRHREGCKPLTGKASTRKAETIIRTSLADFLKQYPVSTLNEYGDQVIYGRRVC